MSARYEISEGELDVLAITGPEGTRYIDGEEIEARVIRQQSADIAELRAELNRERETNAVLRRDLAEPPPDIQELALKKCGHFEIVAKLRADLAAAVAERDRLIAELPLSTGRDVNETRERLGPITRIADGPSERAYVCATTAREVVGYVIAERDSAKLRAEQAEARLSAIDSAPVVAHIANKISPDYFPCGLTILADSKLPPLGTDLIAKPAKDQTP